MKTLALSTFLVLSLVTSATAQVPIVQVYLDSELVTIDRHCVAFGEIDTIYVAVSNFMQPIVDVEYRIETRGSFFLIQDLVPDGYTIDGYSGTGIRVSFGGAVAAFGKVLVEGVVGGWFCESDCSGGPGIITVEPHPESGRVQATAWPDLVKIEATGGVNFLCGALPVEPTTWGSIKALYR